MAEVELAEDVSTRQLHTAGSSALEVRNGALAAHSAATASSTHRAARPVRQHRCTVVQATGAERSVYTGIRAD